MTRAQDLAQIEKDAVADIEPKTEVNCYDNS
jgi:hypothetical protein